MKIPFTLIVAACFVGSILAQQPSSLAARAVDAEAVLNAVAEDYVRLVLAVGQHDPDYVDAYYGPVEWKKAAEQAKKPLAELAGMAQTALRQWHAVDATGLQGLLRERYVFLGSQLRAVEGRIAQLGGRKLSFDEESRLIFDAVLPEMPEPQRSEILGKLEALLPGDGALVDRFEKFENQFVVPKDKVDGVMRAAIAECRRRTRAHIALPEAEAFQLEYVTGQPWSAYNWFQGGARSVIQINLDLPFRLSQAIGLAAHEGYPGHHVNLGLLERTMKPRGWVEYQVSPLFAPASVIAEGIADYGIEVVFPLAERVQFEREVLFPLAGLDPAQAARYGEVIRLKRELGLVSAGISRRFLDGGLTRAEAVERLVNEALIPRARAEKSLAFATRYRSYLITYEAGYQLVKQYVDARCGSVDDAKRRWEIFAQLLSASPVPSELRRP